MRAGGYPPARFYLLSRLQKLEQKKSATPIEEMALFLLADEMSYALKELPHPQVDFTFGLLNLNPEPSSVSTKSTCAPSR